MKTKKIIVSALLCINSMVYAQMESTNLGIRGGTELRTSGLAVGIPIGKPGRTAKFTSENMVGKNRASFIFLTSIVGVKKQITRRSNFRFITGPGLHGSLLRNKAYNPPEKTIYSFSHTPGTQGSNIFTDSNQADRGVEHNQGVYNPDSAKDEPSKNPICTLDDSCNCGHPMPSSSGGGGSTDGNHYVLGTPGSSSVHSHNERQKENKFLAFLIRHSIGFDYLIGVEYKVKKLPVYVRLDYKPSFDFGKINWLDCGVSVTYIF